MTVDAPCSLVPCQLWLWVTRAFASQILIGVAEASAHPLLGSDRHHVGGSGAGPALQGLLGLDSGSSGPVLPGVATCEQTQASFL